FIVDNFKSQAVGDPAHPDYLCSIDMTKGELRPFFSMYNVNMLESKNNNTERLSTGYQLSGDILTLPIIEHVPCVEQPYGSRVENVNPFAVFTFIGSMNLNPSSDEWFETDRRPDIVNNVEGNFNSMR
ncbi:MAG: DUF4815 domain-containing protein, partial [Flammeovirgaceae bacterium]